MKMLENRIAAEGRVLGTDILKVDAFLNHQIDPVLMQAIGKEIARLFDHDRIDKIVTVETSGIAPAVFAAAELGVPLVFAKKKAAITMTDENYMADVYSFTKKETNHIIIDKKFLSAGERILLVDDFLANGQAMNGLLAIMDAAQASVVGAAIVIEKAFQPGHEILDERGIRLESLAKIADFKDGKVIFA
ncbi:xanthine phosphoribosyltransferase [Weissella oryzae SG25]|uniref:Xanthine phosphoribosyltransferase n=1 Tax=Weissella oryzae (strain DSM 25784 / JCM 18191 / LMG 30913 / SG25) TaxID=1329250 RepID=A0A069CZJ4_WEIOS|nr:xanthine phosphoribosyltransferase [Weissella oryzae]GAK30516.1 xanthine phosphoribosyltransferase [Weissella oryzae SG25]